MYARPSTQNSPLPLAGPLSYPSFLERLVAKDRVNAEKHAAICDADPDPRHAILWRRLACHLMALAGHSAKLNRQPQSVQFYRADGKYRMQVFALEDSLQGKLSIYCGDVLDQVEESGILASQERGDQVSTDGGSHSGDTLKIERLESNSPSPAGHFKDMLGWNRRAIRMTLSVGASASEVETVEAICALTLRAKASPLARALP